LNVNEVIKLIIGNLPSSHLDAKLEAFILLCIFHIGFS